MIKEPNFKELERMVISNKKNQSVLGDILNQVLSYKHTLDRIMTQFLDDYGHKLDNEHPKNAKYFKFVKIKSEQYEQATRLIRIINSYS